MSERWPRFTEAMTALDWALVAGAALLAALLAVWVYLRTSR